MKPYFKKTDTAQTVSPYLLFTSHRMKQVRKKWITACLLSNVNMPLPLIANCLEKAIIKHPTSSSAGTPYPQKNRNSLRTIVSRVKD